MGIFDIFRKKRIATENEKLNLADLEAWLKSQKSDIASKQSNILSLINSEISKIIDDLEENAENLEKINLNDKKVEERIKLIVKENLYYYNLNLKRLIENLKDLKESSPELLIEKINLLFFNFEKKSSINFEKATFLIGKELEAVKISINNVFRDLKKILDENDGFFKKIKIISSIEKHFSEFENAKKTKQEIMEVIENIKQKIADAEDSINEITKNMEKSRNSKEYLEEREKEEELHFKKQKLKKEFSRLKESIDFKYLASIFHSDEKKMHKLKEFMNNFEESIESPEFLIGMMSHANLKTIDISQKIRDLFELKRQLNSTSMESLKIQERNIKNLENEIKRLNSEIISLNENRLREMKKHDRFEEIEKNLLKNMKDELIKISVELK